MERIRLRFKSMLLLFGLVIAMGCGIPSICMTEKEVMAEEVTPAVGDEFTSEGITYRITSLPGTYAGKLSVTDGKAAEGNVVLKDGMEYAGGAYDVVELAASAFAGNTNLTGIDLSKTSVSSIKASCFSGCTELSSLEMPDYPGTVNLYNNVFSSCSNLKSLMIERRLAINSTSSPFRNSGLETVICMDASGPWKNTTCNGVKDGFTLIFPNTLSNNLLPNAVFGTAANVTLVVPNAASKTNYETVFAGKDVKVQLLSGTEEESTVFVRGMGSELTGFATLTDAIKAINDSDYAGPFQISAQTVSGKIQWTEDVTPNKETVIDFRGNSVNMPDTLTLQAPLTIKNVTNFEDEDALCALNAGNYPFTMIDGGSFGFTEMKGSNITISGTLPGSKPLGNPCQLIGTGYNASLTIQSIGRSNYYYDLPEVTNFASVNLENSYMEINRVSSESKLAAIAKTSFTLANGGLTLNGAVQIKKLSGKGEIRYGENGSFYSTSTSAGTFQLPEYEGTTIRWSQFRVPRNSTSGLFLTNKNGEPITIEDTVATVDDGTNKTEYYSVKEALDGIEAGDESKTYTLMIHKNATLEPNTVLPNKKMKINAYQYTLTMESGALTVQNDLEFVSCTLNMEHADILLKMASAGNHTVILPQQTGKVHAVREEFANGIVPDTDVKIPGSGKGINLQIGELTGATDGNGKARMDVILYMCGTVNKYSNFPCTPDFIKKAASVELTGSTWLSLSGNWEQLGCIRTSSTSCGLILTDDTVIDSFSLPTSSTTYMSELRIPAGNTLTTTNTSTGYLKMTIEGTPEAGHVFIHAADSASSKMDVKPVTLPEGMELVCVNTQDGVREYVLKNTNDWTEELKAATWIENEMPKDALKAEAKYGEVIYQFSGEIDGTYQNGLPEKEGTWYVKAGVSAGTDYIGLEGTPVEVQITAPRKVEKIVIKNQPDQLVYEEGEKLNLSGLVIITTDNYGKETEIAVTDFAENGISISLANKTVLTTKENGLAIEITSNGITAKTNTLTVTVKKIGKPEVPEKPAEGTTEKPEKPSEGTTATTEKPSEGTTPTTEKPSENTTPAQNQAVTDNKSLRLVGAAGRTSIKLKWTKNNSADGYQIYGTTCGKNKYRLLKTVTKNSVTTWTKTKLKKATSYRFYIRAYKMSNGKKVYLQKSNEIHVVTLGGKATNAKNVKVTSNVIKLEKGKTKKIVAKVSYVNNKQKTLKHAAGLKYDTSNKKIASVTTKGVIQAVGKGSCNIYVYAGNGAYAKVKIIVK